MNAAKTVLVTGATGFIGSHLVARALKEGNRVRAFVLRGDPKARELEARGVDVVYGDIRDAQAVAEVVRGSQIVFHLAAVVTDWAPRWLFEAVNVEGMRHVCRAALESGVERLVEVSTNDVFGLREDIEIDERCDFRGWGEPYPDTKLAATRIAWEFSRQGLPVSLVYPCWIYGPGDVTFVPLLADAIRKNQLFFWRKDVIVWPAYIENVVDLLWLVSWHPAAVGQGFLVHDGVSDTLQGFSRKIAAAIGAREPRTRVPYAAARASAWAMELAWRAFGKKTRPLLTRYTVKNLGSRLRFSVLKAKELLGWTPPTSYEEGFRRTLEWLKRTDPGLWKQK